MRCETFDFQVYDQRTSTMPGNFSFRSDFRATAGDGRRKIVPRDSSMTLREEAENSMSPSCTNIGLPELAAAQRIIFNVSDTYTRRRVCNISSVHLNSRRVASKALEISRLDLSIRSESLNKFERDSMRHLLRALG